ncbi:hypothetical protein J8F10_21295 [Gemmata sp. G18]|uniref:Uncharacterized protein n=1 Tax=Gemmata palustris TaxID=2822762 RepID=A0ABS5BVN7_9BACT|nr:hypothetical protein [Gemmata palustris]MBP3957796.1 hypothetical protein [Gemmata palustris]
MTQKPNPARALPAAKWVPILDAAGLTPQAFADAKTPHARAIKIGQWLSAKVGRETPVHVGGRNGTAVLRVIGARANEKRYYFEVTWDSAAPAALPPPPKGEPSKTKKKPKQNEKHKAKARPSAKHKHKAGNDEAW